MIIDVFSDPICPWCYIGKRRLERALIESGRNRTTTVRWRAFQLNPDMPAGGMARDTYLALKFGDQERASAVYRNIAAAGAGEDIAFAFEGIERTPNTVDAHRLIRHAARHGKDANVVEGLFRAYFLDALDIGDIDVLTAVAAGNGLNAATTRVFLDGTQDAAEVRVEQDFAASLNITGVPCFIADNQYVVTGAREPEAFIPLFDLIAEESRLAAGP